MDERINRRKWIAGSGLLTLSALDKRALALSPSTTAPATLSLNENAYGPSPLVAPAIARKLTSLERYVDDKEVAALSRQIAALENVDPEHVVLGEVLEPLGLHLARDRANGSVVYSSPGYTALVDAAVPLGTRGIAVPLNDRLENDLPSLDRAIDSSTLAVSLVNPHNPSGTVNDSAAFDAFIDGVSAHTLVVVDEAYLEYDEPSARSAVRFVRAGVNVMVFRTLAKIYGLAGLSFGYALAPKRLAASMRAAGMGMPHALNRLSLVAASAALSDQAHIQAIRARVSAERARVTTELRRLGLRHSESRANFVYFLSPNPAAAARKAFSDRGIQVARPFPPLDEWIRITIGLPSENDGVIDVLKAIYHSPSA
jgi:histidinol-phosphate aminotransferase